MRIKYLLRKKLRLLLLAIAVPLCLSSNAGGKILDRGDYLTDTQSNLDWLDVTASANMSYNDIAKQLGKGGQFEGWRFATVGEFNTLINNATGTNRTSFEVYHHNEEGEAAITAIKSLIQMLGSTLDSMYLASHGQTYNTHRNLPKEKGSAYTLGYLFDKDTNNRRYVGEISAHSEYTDLAQSQVFIPYWYQNDNAKEINIGAYLVRTSISPKKLD